MELLKTYLRFCFSFKGRLNRKAFALYFFRLFFFAILFLSPWLLMPEDSTPPVHVTIIAVTILLVPILLIGAGIFSCFVKRCHDLNFSGWWFFIFSILANAVNNLTDDDGDSRFPDILPNPITLSILLVCLLISVVLYYFLFFVKGTKGENKYGPDPLEKSN